MIDGSLSITPHPELIPLTAKGPYLTAGQAASRLGADRKTLGKWSKEKRLPCIRTAGGHRRFLESDVEAALAGFNVPPAQRGGVKKETHAGDAVIDLGSSWMYRIHGEPMTDGTRLVLGRTSSGRDLVVTVRSTGWLDALDAAVRAMRAASNGGPPVRVAHPSDEDRCGTCGYTTACCTCTGPS